MPHRNHNRIIGDLALNTHAVWQTSIGYDPHAPLPSGHPASTLTLTAPLAPAPPGQSAYDRFHALLKVAQGRRPCVNAGTCRKCGGSGHLTFACRNTAAAAASHSGMGGQARRSEEPRQGNRANSYVHRAGSNSIDALASTSSSDAVPWYQTEENKSGKEVEDRAEGKKRRRDDKRDRQSRSDEERREQKKRRREKKEKKNNKEKKRERNERARKCKKGKERK